MAAINIGMARLQPSLSAHAPGRRGADPTQLDTRKDEAGAKLMDSSYANSAEGAEATIIPMIVIAQATAATEPEAPLAAMVAGGMKSRAATNGIDFDSQDAGERGDFGTDTGRHLLPSYFSAPHLTYRNHMHDPYATAPSVCRFLFFVGIIFAPAWFIGVGIYCRHRLEEVGLLQDLVWFPLRLCHECSSVGDVAGRQRHEAEVLWGRRCGLGILTFLGMVGGLIMLLYFIVVFDTAAHSNY